MSPTPRSRRALSNGVNVTVSRFPKTTPRRPHLLAQSFHDQNDMKRQKIEPPVNGVGNAVADENSRNRARAPMDWDKRRAFLGQGLVLRMPGSMVG